MPTPPALALSPPVKDFLTLWKDADPDIPILKQAQAKHYLKFCSLSLRLRVHLIAALSGLEQAKQVRGVVLSNARLVRALISAHS